MEKENKLEINIELIGADELIEKLEQIKKLLDEITNMDFNIEVK